LDGPAAFRCLWTKNGPTRSRARRTRMPSDLPEHAATPTAAEKDDPRPGGDGFARHRAIEDQRFPSSICEDVARDAVGASSTRPGVVRACCPFAASRRQPVHTLSSSTPGRPSMVWSAVCVQPVALDAVPRRRHMMTNETKPETTGGRRRAQGDRLRAVGILTAVPVLIPDALRQRATPRCSPGQ
jgi:hypothetical protein